MAEGVWPGSILAQRATTSRRRNFSRDVQAPNKVKLIWAGLYCRAPHDADAATRLDASRGELHSGSIEFWGEDPGVVHGTRTGRALLSDATRWADSTHPRLRTGIPRDRCRANGAHLDKPGLDFGLDSIFEVRFLKNPGASL